MDRRRIFVRFLPSRLSLARVIPPDPPSLSLLLALPVPKEKASFLSGVILLGEGEGGYQIAAHAPPNAGEGFDNTVGSPKCLCTLPFRVACQ